MQDYTFMNSADNSKAVAAAVERLVKFHGHARVAEHYAMTYARSHSKLGTRSRVERAFWFAVSHAIRAAYPV